VPDVVGGDRFPQVSQQGHGSGGPRPEAGSLTMRSAISRPRSRPALRAPAPPGHPTPAGPAL